jgi:DNA polymerase-3 subunit epsilon
VAEVLEDGILTTDEANALREVAEIHDLDSSAVAATHRAFVLALAHEAVADGKVTRAERSELLSVADLLDVGSTSVRKLLDRAEDVRNDKLGSNLKPLPGDWLHGEPLRVGDRVVFTGCDPVLRKILEDQSASAGVLVMGNVASTTAMLVTDGTMDGTKLAKARDLQTRIVSPEEYRLLLEFVQPAARRKASTRPQTPAARATESAPVGALGDSAGSDRPEAVPDLLTRDVTPAVIRAWARQNGWEVGVRGRLPAPLLKAYELAHPDRSHSVDVN